MPFECTMALKAHSNSFASSFALNIVWLIHVGHCSCTDKTCVLLATVSPCVSLEPLRSGAGGALGGAGLSDPHLSFSLFLSRSSLNKWSVFSLDWVRRMCYSMLGTTRPEKGGGGDIRHLGKDKTVSSEFHRWSPSQCQNDLTPSCIKSIKHLHLLWSIKIIICNSDRMIEFNDTFLIVFQSDS